MKNTFPFPNWLTKRMLKGVRGFNVDAYLMALEGWRRGLTLTWYADPTKVTDLKLIGFNPLGKSFSLTDNKTKTTHYFYRSRGDKVANEAVDIVHHKYQAKENFNKSNVPTPKGIMIDQATSQAEVKEAINALTFPLVVKPALGSLGKGVTTNIQNEEELFDAVQQIKEKYENYHEIIVEEYVNGEEYRVYVVGNEVAAVTKRIPANVTGDGVSSIKQLIDKKNEARKDNPYLARKPIEIDDTIITYLEKQNIRIDDVPEKNESVRLKGQANISAGGDPIDATDDLDETSKQIAIEAVQSIPNLCHAGVDIIVNPDKTIVLEVNATADLAMHVFPMQGEPRNVPAAIMNYYYPDTTNHAINKVSLFFDYRDIRKLLRNKLAEEITLTDAPKEKFYKTRYLVSGKVQKVGYRNWIRTRAVKQGLHGYTRNLKDGKVVVVVGGNEKEVKDFKKVCERGPKRAEVKEVTELDWDQSIKLGFEIRRK